MIKLDTICALATPQGRAGVAVTRLSGPDAYPIAKIICGIDLQPRYAHTATFFDQQETIDQGLAIYFPAPHSFTGDDVVEFHTHSNPFIYQRLVNCLCQQGARLAIAGEFSERAFTNGKLDLTQLEAIADLIASGSEQAARSAVMSMQGIFATQVQNIIEHIIRVRTHVEASLDFSEEDIEIETRQNIQQELLEIDEATNQLFTIAQQGVQIQQSACVTIIGKPNVGKSSLLNALSESQQAIVTDIPGTTRDIVSVDVLLNGMQIRLMDTAGMRSSADVVEQEGIERAKQAAQNADLVIEVLDASEYQDIAENKQRIVVVNKIDLSQTDTTSFPSFIIKTSAKTGKGLDDLRAEIVRRLEQHNPEQQTPFSARARHLEAMRKSKEALQTSQTMLNDGIVLELVAEELRLGQKHLEEITGQFTPDDLLDYVFREFCIGK